MVGSGQRGTPGFGLAGSEPACWRGLIGVAGESGDFHGRFSPTATRSPLSTTTRARDGDRLHFGKTRAGNHPWGYSVAKTKGWPAFRRGIPLVTSAISKTHGSRQPRNTALAGGQFPRYLVIHNLNYTKVRNFAIYRKAVLTKSHLALGSVMRNHGLQFFVP